MSRGVNFLNEAIVVAYILTEQFVGTEEEEVIEEWHWNEARDGVVDRLKENWPSFEEAEGWDNKETRIAAENGHAIVGVSEYCGITSVSIAVNDMSDNPELSEAWINRIAGKFEDVFGTIRKIGTFSNGESVYEDIAE
jgi:hypothetical protein